MVSKKFERHTWGGRREGAGRKASGPPAVSAWYRLPAELVDAVKAEADRRGVTASRLAAELLAAGLAVTEGGA